MVGIAHPLVSTYHNGSQVHISDIGPHGYVYNGNTSMEAPDTVQVPPSPGPYTTTPHLYTFSDIFIFAHQPLSCTYRLVELFETQKRSQHALSVNRRPETINFSILMALSLLNRSLMDRLKSICGAGRPPRPLFPSRMDLKDHGQL